MEAHEALGRFEKVSEGQSQPPGPGGPLARDAAVMVAVLAAFLAVATFMSNEAVKEVITRETKGADNNARLEANDVKAIIASANSVLLRVVGTGNPQETTAVRKAEELEGRIESQLKPIDERLAAKVGADQKERDRADNRHVLFELSQVGLQVGIVLAGISIIARRRWLLGGGGLMGLAGIGVLIAGVLY